MRAIVALTLVVAMSADAIGGVPGLSDALRLRSEAAGVFLAVMADDDQPQRCQFELNWNRYSIPEWLSKEELGSNAPEIIASPTESLPYAEALDPNGRSMQSFCSQNDASIYFRDNPGRRSLYSFPAFSRDGNTAIVIDVEDVSVGKRSTLFSITALILEKRLNGWKLDRYVRLAIS